MEYIYHDGIQKEIAALERRFRTLKDGFAKFERLCAKQFDPQDPKPAIGPAKLHRVSANPLWTLWKVELVLPNSGLRPSQFPRMWFAVKGTVVAFLCIASHVDNYDDAEQAQLALLRITDIF